MLVLFLQRSGLILNKPAQKKRTTTNRSSFIHGSFTTLSVTAEAWILPVLVKWVCDEFGIERDVGEAVAVLHTTHHPWPGHTGHALFVCLNQPCFLIIGKTKSTTLITSHRSYGDNSTYLSGIALCAAGLLKVKTQIIFSLKVTNT